MNQIRKAWLPVCDMAAISTLNMTINSRHNMPAGRNGRHQEQKKKMNFPVSLHWAK